MRREPPDYPAAFIDDLREVESDVHRLWRTIRRLRRALRQARGELRVALRHRNQVRNSLAAWRSLRKGRY
jgi:hypothetical protein